MELIKDNSKKIKRFKRFITHRIVTYAVICSFLALVNYMTSPLYWWVLWVIAGWGLGISLNIFYYWMDMNDEE